MPLWQIFQPDGTFEDESTKAAFAKDITKWYRDVVGLPAFYVSVCFHKMSGSTLWAGGEIPREEPFIRISIDHIAVTLSDDNAMYNRTASQVNDIMKPHIADKGYTWEFHVNETDRRLWRIDGLVPPPFKREEEKVWVRENKSSSWQGDNHAVKGMKLPSRVRKRVTEVVRGLDSLKNRQDWAATIALQIFLGVDCLRVIFDEGQYTPSVPGRMFPRVRRISYLSIPYLHATEEGAILVSEKHIEYSGMRHLRYLSKVLRSTDAEEVSAIFPQSVMRCILKTTPISQFESKFFDDSTAIEHCARELTTIVASQGDGDESFWDIDKSRDTGKWLIAVMNLDTRTVTSLRKLMVVDVNDMPVQVW